MTRRNGLVVVAGVIGMACLAAGCEEKAPPPKTAPKPATPAAPTGNTGATTATGTPATPR
jgi:hypothetical protein